MHWFCAIHALEKVVILYFTLPVCWALMLRCLRLFFSVVIIQRSSGGVGAVQQSWIQICE